MLLTVVGGEICYLGVEFTGIDAAGRTTGLWAAPLAGGPPRRLTDEDTVDVDRAAGRRWSRSGWTSGCWSRCWTAARRHCVRCRCR